MVQPPALLPTRHGDRLEKTALGQGWLATSLMRGMRGRLRFWVLTNIPRPLKPPSPRGGSTARPILSLGDWQVVKFDGCDVVNGNSQNRKAAGRGRESLVWPAHGPCWVGGLQACVSVAELSDILQLLTILPLLSSARRGSKKAPRIAEVAFDLCRCFGERFSCC